VFVIVNLYGERLSSLGSFESHEDAERVAREEWSKGWEVYVSELDEEEER